jgi:hypothetical protein
MQVERSGGSLLPKLSGERVSNTWATCPIDWDNLGKPKLIPDTIIDRLVDDGKSERHYRMGPRRIS